MFSFHLEIDYSFRNFVISFIYLFLLHPHVISNIQDQYRSFLPQIISHCSLPDPLSKEFSRQKNWSGQPLPSPGGLPDPGIEPGSSALQAGDCLSHQRSLSFIGHFCHKSSTYPNV